MRIHLIRGLLLVFYLGPPLCKGVLELCIIIILGHGNILGGFSAPGPHFFSFCLSFPPLLLLLCTIPRDSSFQYNPTSTWHIINARPSIEWAMASVECNRPRLLFFARFYSLCTYSSCDSCPPFTCALTAFILSHSSVGKRSRFKCKSRRQK